MDVTFNAEYHTMVQALMEIHMRVSEYGWLPVPRSNLYVAEDTKEQKSKREGVARASAPGSTRVSHIHSTSLSPIAPALISDIVPYGFLSFSVVR